MTPEQEEAVRRALAAEPPAEPMPPEVSARLDATLADLVARRSSEPSGEPDETVADLTAARSRRWPNLLVAAAGVAVLGIGVGAVLQNSGGSDSSTAGVAVDSAAEDGGESATEADPRSETLDEGPLAGSEGPPAEAGPLLALRLSPATLRSDSLDADVARVVSQRQARGAEVQGELVPDEKVRAPEADDAARLLSDCELPATSPGDLLVAARFDGDRSTLVVRGAEGGTRVAQVYACDDAGVLLATTEVDAR